MDNFLTLKEAATYLKVSRTTLWRYCRTGIVKARRISKKLYFKKSELDELLDESVYVAQTRGKKNGSNN